MLTAAVCGGVFASPNVDQITAAIRAVTGNDAVGCRVDSRVDNMVDEMDFRHILYIIK